MTDGPRAAPPRRGHRRLGPGRARGPAGAPARALPAPAAPPSPAETGNLGVPAAGTLARRLILQVTAITTLVALFLGGITTVVAQRVLLEQLDERLSAVLTRQPGPDNNAQGYPEGINLPGQPIGTVVVYLSQTTAISGYLTNDGIQGVPSNAALKTLAAVVPDRAPVTVDLYMMGPYRAISTYIDGQQVIVGLPLADTRAVIVRVVSTFGAISLLAIVVSLASVYLVVVRNLRPMTDLAAVAREVTATPLEHGHVDLQVRAPVPPPGHAAEVADVSDAFNQMLGHVESALQARQSSESKVRRFVADASHELRNPLAAIRGYAELTRRDRASMPAQTARALDRIDAEAERMSALVEDLLLLARLDNNPTPATEPVDLSEIVVNATADAQAAGPEHRWSLGVPPEPVVTIGDRHQLHQVTANLLANARTHTPPGTQVHAALSVQPDPATGRQCAVISIRDNGPGIPAAMVDQVFDRFVRADSARARIPDASIRSGSTGLGLSIVQAVVEAHGGTVTIDSRAAADLPPGSTGAATWTTLTVRLPLAPAPASASPVVAAAREQVSPIGVAGSSQ
ncbi:two-component system, OmpR family, sensor kinase [Raineyella antarctica]|uniref:histidine kinase n=1 Tax=Raineyella antarctica TaxID=1577474 RepID=A0A1G6H8E6_9ACTN|nr:HAMP domain-containing sensor histidine kinase [Raineyella antarctica]SDB90368.1 two-component system, OmpR family, sensor kinase [Raineyella antarctica]